MKGKHRKSRRDDFRSDKEYDTRPSTSKDFNQRPYSPAKKVKKDDLLLRKDGKRTDPFMHTKQDGFESRKKERTPPHLSPKHKVNVSNSPKTGSEQISVTVKASPSQKRKRIGLQRKGARMT